MTKQFKFDMDGTIQQQCAALCYRRKKSGIKILLITSRDTGRWVMPKGWPVKKLGGKGTAASEAWEEAGVVGKVGDKPVGAYRYAKLLDSTTSVDCLVQVYPLEVTKLQDSYPERKQRVRRWFSRSGAAKRVDEPDLREIILAFQPPSD